MSSALWLMTPAPDSILLTPDSSLLPSVFYPAYDSSCSIFDSTQSNSPDVIFPPQNSQTPALLTLSGAPQLGQFRSALAGTGLVFRLRMNVQYSLQYLGVVFEPQTTLPLESTV